MKEVFKIISVLTVICLICSFMLSFVYSLASKKIKMQEERAIKEAILELIPLKRIKEEIYANLPLYKLFNEEDELLGYAFLAEGNGYQGKIKILAVSDPDIDTLKGIEIIESVETPGLGARIQEDFFKKQFVGLKVSPKIEYIKKGSRGENQINAITGATISSKSVVNILNKRIEELRKLTND